LRMAMIYYFLLPVVGTRQLSADRDFKRAYFVNT
jgi:hypothetical protein